MDVCSKPMEEQRAVRCVNKDISHHQIEHLLSSAALTCTRVQVRDRIWRQHLPRDVDLVSHVCKHVTAHASAGRGMCTLHTTCLAQHSAEAEACTRYTPPAWHLQTHTQSSCESIPCPRRALHSDQLCVIFIYQSIPPIVRYLHTCIICPFALQLLR